MRLPWFSVAPSELSRHNPSINSGSQLGFPERIEVAREKDLTPRKRPVQARSRLTVGAILQATAQLLVSHGYDQMTTNLVAERAGVSVGSLYEYFPNKEALVAALASEHVEDLAARVDAALRDLAGKPPEAFISGLVRAGLDAHRIDPALHKVLVEQVPRIGTLRDVLDISILLQRKIASGLQQWAPSLAPGRIRMVAFVLETCVEALTHSAVITEPDWLETDEMEAEALRLLAPYFERTFFGLISRPP